MWEFYDNGHHGVIYHCQGCGAIVSVSTDIIPGFADHCDVPCPHCHTVLAYDIRSDNSPDVEIVEPGNPPLPIDLLEYVRAHADAEREARLAMFRKQWEESELRRKEQQRQQAEVDAEAARAKIREAESAAEDLRRAEARRLESVRAAGRVRQVEIRATRARILDQARTASTEGERIELARQFKETLK